MINDTVRWLVRPLKPVLRTWKRLQRRSDLRAARMRTRSLPPSTPGGKTFREYADAWLAGRVRTGMRSAKDYRSTFDNYLFPVFGDKTLSEITKRDVRQFVQELRGEAELAPRTMLNIYGCLRSVMSAAVDEELIDKTPCSLRKHDLPPNDDKDPEFRRRAIFDRAEVDKIVSSKDIPIRWRTLYTTLFFTGARVGELLGLTWDRVDLGRGPLGCVIIAKSYSTKNGSITNTKTNVVREVPIHPELHRAILAWRSRYEAIYRVEPAGTRLVFPTRRGTPQRSTSVLHRFQDQDLPRLGLRRRRIHDTRRTFISLTCKDGCSRDVIKRITHARGGEVFDAYREVFWEEACREISKLQIGSQPQPKPASTKAPALKPTRTRKAKKTTEGAK